MKVGDVVLITEYYLLSDKNELSEPALGVINSIEGDEIGHLWFLTDHENLSSSWNWAFNNKDKFEVIPQEDWSDEVCVLMAKRALLA